jgi:hypothetical protein
MKWIQGLCDECRDQLANIGKHLSDLPPGNDSVLSAALKDLFEVRNTLAQITNTTNVNTRRYTTKAQPSVN